MNDIPAFKVKVDGKLLDYRLGKPMNLAQAQSFFAKKYSVKKIWSGGRYVMGILEKNNHDYFLKLATTEGISALTKVEYVWNEAFTRQLPHSSSSFWVPKNFEHGYYHDSLFYLITDYFKSQLLAAGPKKGAESAHFSNRIGDVIGFTQTIEQLRPFSFGQNTPNKSVNYRQWFMSKVDVWFQSIPQDVRLNNQLEKLLEVVTDSINHLEKRPRHGDFTPWHLVDLNDGRLGLIDGEHAMSDGVEGYDIAYFIQRVASVLKNPKLAELVLKRAVRNGYQLHKLKPVLAARGIGGYLDESLVTKPNYSYANQFRDWVLTL